MEPQENLPEEFGDTAGQFHHFQLVAPDGTIPLSISVLIRLHSQPESGSVPSSVTPISSNDVIALHEALKTFDGNFIAAFKSR